MIASVVILFTSAVLFAYWFRYTCVLILSAKTSADYAGDVAMANSMSFLEVQSELPAASKARFAMLEASLDRDYALVSNLLERAIGNDEEGGSLEHAMLRIDFYAMKGLLRVTGPVSESFARGALSEMSQIVSHLANSLGERACTEAQSS